MCASICPRRTLFLRLNIVCGPGRLGAWVPGGLGAFGPGGLGAWRPGGLAAWRPGGLVAWRPGPWDFGAC